MSVRCKHINSRLFGMTELGALMARTSRDARGFGEIALSVQHIPPHERTEAIMKFVEYGHASILDLMEVPMYFTEITMYQAARLFQFSPRGNGQEASTRYINNNPNWEATFKQKRVEGRLDNIREVIPIEAKTSVVLRQSLRDWAHVMALCYWSGQGAMERLSDAIDDELACVLLPSEKVFVDSYIDKLQSHDTKAGKAMNSRFGTLAMEDREDSSEGVSFMMFNGLYLIEIVESIPFYILRDLNRHRNRIVTAWTTPYYTETTPMSEPVLCRFVMTLEQFKYEYGTRTTKEADPAYAALYHKWAEQLKEIF